MDQRKLLEAANRLRSPELKPFMDWLQSQRVLDLELLSTAPEHALQRLQGSAQRLKTILNLIETASAALSELEG